MSRPPAIAITSTTEFIRHVPRVRANEAYTQAARAAGMRPYILPPLDPRDADDMLEGMDGLMLTGGEDIDPALYGAARHATVEDVHSQRDAFEMALVHAARERKLPTLAICRGIQIANVALGGTLVQDIPSEWPDALSHENVRDQRTHTVLLAPSSRLAKLLDAQEIGVNSVHHQAVGQLGSGLVATAHAPDGIIEGAEWTGDDWWLVGVQWHPEEMISTAEPWDRKLFSAFASAARERFAL